MPTAIGIGLGMQYGEGPGWSGPSVPLQGNLPSLWLRADQGVYTGGSRQFYAADKAYLEASDTGNVLDPLTSDFAVSFWFYLDSATNHYAFSKGSSAQFFACIIDSSYRVRFLMGDGVGTDVDNTFTGAAGALSTWTHVVINCDRDGNAEAFINGVSAGTVSISGIAGSINTSRGFRLGTNGSSNPTIFYNGRLSKFSFSTRIYTAAEIAWLYNLKNGRLYGELGVAGTDGSNLLTGLVSYWNLNESTATSSAIDQHSTNDLSIVGAELLSNTGFETAGAGGADVFANWTETTAGTSTVNDETVDFDAGAHACRFDIDASNSNTTVGQSVLIIGNTYSVSCRVKQSSGSSTTVLRAQLGNTLLLFSSTTSWATQTGSGVCTSNTNFLLARGASAASLSLYFDTVSCKSSGINVGEGPASEIASDSIGSNHGLLTNFGGLTSSVWSTDIPTVFGSGMSLDLDGTNDMVNCGSDSSLDDLLNADCTFSIWVKLDTLPSVNARLFDKTNSSGVAGPAWYVQSDGTMTFTADFATDLNFRTVEALSTGTWYMVGVSYIASTKTAKIYINGTESTYSASTAAVGSIVSDAANSLGIGGALSVASRNIDGKLKDARIYTSALSAAQHAELAAGSEATGATPISRWKFDDGPQSGVTDGDPVVCWQSIDSNRRQLCQTTASKRPSYVASGINSKPAIDFDGTDDLLMASTAFLTGTSGTVIVVYRIDATVNTYKVLLGSSDESSSNRFIMFMGDGGTANRHINYQQQEADTADLLDGDSATNLNTNYCAVWQSDGTTVTARLNGTAQTLNADAGSNNGDWWSDTTAKDNVTIGARRSNAAVEDRFMDGKIAEIIVYPVNLTAGSIAQLSTYIATRYGVPV